MEPERAPTITRAKGWGLIVAAGAATIPAAAVRFGLLDASVEIETLLLGVAIVGAAFLLSWGGEVAQLDISQSLALAFLAFVAVLPEYAVDLTYAWKAGAQDAAEVCRTVAGAAEPCARSLAVANMTGANRLLIGVGWAVVVLLWAARTGKTRVDLEEARRTELGFLLIATLWAFTIPLRGELGLLDVVVLGLMFAGYVRRAAQHDSEHPELIGPPELVAALPPLPRRLATIGLFVFAAAMILVAAEPFADGLVDVGSKLGVSHFLLVQWIGPLASEAPEMIIAILLVLRANPGTGLGALVSSKVNQWTLLIATIPLVYAIGRGGVHALELDARQTTEIVLTAAQSAFAAGVLANLSISRLEAIGLLVLFLAQFGLESTSVRYGFAAAYIVLLIGILASQPDARRGLILALRDAVTPPRRTGRKQ